MRAAYSCKEGCVKALLAAGADKEARDNVSSRDACDDPWMADPSDDLSMDRQPSSRLSAGGMRRAHPSYV